MTLLIFYWDIFCISLLSLFWFTFYNTPPKLIRKEAQLLDSKNIIVFVTVIVASALSFLSVILLFINHAKPLYEFRLIVIVACMVLSWMILHTIFTVRYAHLYYSNHKSEEGRFSGGLDFPSEDEPDFIDFAYFSFTLGMTFQVSDVAISSRKIRRIVLLHSLLSFGFNATIVAMSVNIIAGL
ncbi:MAG: DUF1345 domain-containing protein [Bacteroidetes bacterium]|nr:DUF1345 domain-containing protein [Bacteroidota bacterium]MCO5277298.1 DUF1345 domain-containing protein [Saprospiraceae bacterium]